MPPPKAEGQCTICTRLYIDHKAGRCVWCGGWLDHHEPGQEQLCREGKARMARAREAAGVELTKVDQAALVGAA